MRDLSAPECSELRATLVSIDVPLDGAGWEEFLERATRYARIAPRRVYAFADPGPS